MEPLTIKINEVEYVRKDLTKETAKDVNGFAYCIVRTTSAGVFAGYLMERNNMEATILNSRRLWYWDGAASLSQLSQEGVKNPSGCKFPCEVPEMILTQVIEIIPCTQTAMESIKGVPIWQR